MSGRIREISKSIEIQWVRGTVLTGFFVVIYFGFRVRVGESLMCEEGKEITRDKSIHLCGDLGAFNCVQVKW